MRWPAMSAVTYLGVGSRSAFTCSVSEGGLERPDRNARQWHSVPAEREIPSGLIPLETAYLGHVPPGGAPTLDLFDQSTVALFGLGASLSSDSVESPCARFWVRARAKPLEMRFEPRSP